MDDIGLCQCGCGGITNIAKTNDIRCGHVKGQHIKYIRGHQFKNHPPRHFNGGVKHDHGYVMVRLPQNTMSTAQGYVQEHNLIAERALGKPIPHGAEVHHVNGIRSDNSNSNLVLCDSHAYHMLLHVRTKAYIATGNAKMRKCHHCQMWDYVENLGRKSMHRRSEQFAHTDCYNKYMREHNRRKKCKSSGIL